LVVGFVRTTLATKRGHRAPAVTVGRRASANDTASRPHPGDFGSKAVLAPRNAGA
jgi:hypothetical protein